MHFPDLIMVKNMFLYFCNLTVPINRQNTIGRELTPSALIQPTGNEQNAVNNWLLKLQPALKLQNQSKSNFLRKLE